MIEEIEADIVVAGGGVAGLMACYHAKKDGARVLLLGGTGGASQRISSFNTALGQDEHDTPEGLLNDMLRAGGYINNIGLAAALTKQVGEQTEMLDRLGVPFARHDGRFTRRKAAGSSQPRAVFSEGMVGVDIARRLMTEIVEGTDGPQARHIRGGLLLDIPTSDRSVTGALAYSPREKRWLRVTAPAVIVATGGAGQLFHTTTNPRGSRGIGYAIALEAGAELVDMEFVSFEPFITWAPEGKHRYDLPTTVLGEGARLRNARGDEFLDTSTVPGKDVMCRAMTQEILEGRGTESNAVYFDLRGMDPKVADSYVQIHQALHAHGLTSSEAMLEVSPTQHYLMGGIRIDSSGASTVLGLYAVGEVAGGAHGAHRLAAGGGLEAVAGGAIAGKSAAGYASRNRGKKVNLSKVLARPELLGVSIPPNSGNRLAALGKALNDGCGILRNDTDLTASVAAIDRVMGENMAGPKDPFVHRSATVAWAIAKGAAARTESRGDHFRTDYPDRDDIRWIGNLIVSTGDETHPTVKYEQAGLAVLNRPGFDGGS